MKSLVNCVVLGLLIEKPSYGYEVAKRFEQRLGDFLRVSRSHVYAAIGALEEEGLVEPMDSDDVAPAGTRRQPKVHYRATAKGVRAYKGWLVAQIGNDPQRPALLSRLVAASSLDDGMLLAILDQFEQECLEQSGGLGGSEGDGGDDAPESALVFGERLVGELQRVTLHAQFMWIDWARDAVRSRASRRRSRRDVQGDESAVA